MTTSGLIIARTELDRDTADLTLARDLASHLAAPIRTLYTMLLGHVKLIRMSWYTRDYM